MMYGMKREKTCVVILIKIIDMITFDDISQSL